MCEQRDRMTGRGLTVYVEWLRQKDPNGGLGGVGSEVEPSPTWEDIQEIMQRRGREARIRADVAYFRGLGLDISEEEVQQSLRNSPLNGLRTSEED